MGRVGKGAGNLAALALPCAIARLMAATARPRSTPASARSHFQCAAWTHARPRSLPEVLLSVAVQAGLPSSCAPLSEAVPSSGEPGHEADGLVAPSRLGQRDQGGLAQGAGVTSCQLLALLSMGHRLAQRLVGQPLAWAQVVQARSCVGGVAARKE